MTSLRKWMPPVAVVAVVAAGALVTGAQARVDLPDKTPAQVLGLAGQAQVDAFSGTVETRSELGLPALPAGPAGQAGLDALALLTGDHRVRLWLDGAERQRVQVLDRLAESNFVHNGNDVWAYQSRENVATHWVLPDAQGDGPKQSAKPGTPTPRPPVSPERLADQFLAKVDKSTEVTVSGAVKVAGRPAYDLRVQPRTDKSLVQEVSIAVDAATGLPLRLRMMAAGQDAPAFEIAYSSLNLDRPAASVFEFTPPPGAKVEEHELPRHRGSWGGKVDDGWFGHPDWKHPGYVAPDQEGETNGSNRSNPLSAAGITMVGEGWETVLVLPAREAPARLPEVLRESMQRVDGGSLLRTALFNVLLTDDGRVLIGAVTPDVLQAAASQ